jgi:signal transduction histidine kinase
MRIGTPKRDLALCRRPETNLLIAGDTTAKTRATTVVALPDVTTQDLDRPYADPNSAAIPYASSNNEPEWVELSAPVSNRQSDSPVDRRWILLRVVAAALIVVAGVVIVGSVASRRTAERQAINNAAHTTDVLADSVVQPAVNDGLFDGQPQSLAKLAAVVHDHVLGPTITRVKLWTDTGEIVYSDEPRLIGERFSLSPDERAVFADPATRADVTDLNEPENRFERGNGKLLEVYRPVWTASGRPLLFETYSPYGAVTQQAGQLWRGFAGITLSSCLLLIVLLVPVLLSLLGRLQRGQQQRAALLQAALDASDAERRRIAGTLHDGVVQELAATSFSLAGGAQQARSAGRPDEAGRLGEASEAVRGNIAGLRSLLVDIYPATLHSAGLAAAIGDLAASARRRVTAIRLELPDDVLASLEPPAEQLIFRVAQEGLRNAIKHAAASEVRLRLGEEPGQHGDIVFDVIDDGIGFDPGPVRDVAGNGHFGIRLLADLCAHEGAGLAVRSRPGSGAWWRLRIPR